MAECHWAPLKIATLHGMSGPQSNTWFLETTWANNPSGISISPPFLHSLWQCYQRCRGMPFALSPQNCPFWWGSKPPPNTLVICVHPTQHPKWNLDGISHSCITQLTADSPCTSQWAAFPKFAPSHRDLDPVEDVVSWAHLNPEPKQYLDWFRQTDTQTMLVSR